MSGYLKSPALVIVAVFSASIFLSGCKGGGNNDDVSEVTHASTLEGVSKWKILAQVSRDDCGERIAPVNQTITVNKNSTSMNVDTTIVKVGAVSTEDGFTFGFADSIGNCVRHYDTKFSNLTNTTADVSIAVGSTCDGVSCQNEWTGTATKVN